MRRQLFILMACALMATLFVGCACHSVQTRDECRFRTQQAPPLAKSCETPADASAENTIGIEWVLEKGWELLLGDETTPATDAEPTANEPLTLFSPEVLRTFDAKLRVDVDKVMSGRDKLGGMHHLIFATDTGIFIFECIEAMGTQCYNSLNLMLIEVPDIFAGQFLK